MQPRLLHTYQNHHLDGKRWDGYAPRDGDIIISTSYKSGTTLTQAIVRQLINWDQGTSDQLESPWPEFRLAPPGVMMDKLEAQTHRRFIKTHIPLDGLTFYPQVRYIIVGRDPRDVFMSWWNHYSNYTDFVYESFNKSPDLVGLPLPPCPADLHQAWREWITRGWFEWESARG
jgi:aryl sulfotransferase